ncbi:uncharacterized protein LOC131669930 [Phymastichus coffea]|uniref:uncharacterized protein LOC131669930 n=1 Tax=Phymastichus coffea TaxID=108790 RepID=UPI00273A7CC4|nr:uncharacterized protein LOC131669930 [Phymastichus coffea]
MKTLIVIISAIIRLSYGQSATISKTHNFRGNNFAFQRFSFENTTLFYALCDRLEDSAAKQCSVVREINAFDSSSDATYCDLTLETDDPLLVIDSKLLVVALGPERVVLVWLERSTVEFESSLRMAIIRMSDCKIAEAAMDFEGAIDDYSVHLDFVAYVDTYELVAKNLSVCSDVSIDGYCRLTYDTDGNRVAGPVAWFTPLFEEIEYVVSVAPRSPDRGHLLLASDYGDYHVYLVKRNGKQVYELGEDPSSDDDYRIAAFNAASDAIGMCYHGHSKFYCWQYDHTGDLRAIVEFESGLTADLRSATMHNTPDGGFIIMTVYCTNFTCRGVDDRYYLTKVDALMAVSGPREIDAIRCNEAESSAWAQFFQNDDADYCLARLCWNNGEDARLDVNTQCYSDKFFRQR